MDNAIKNCPFCNGKVKILNEIDITTMFKCENCFSLFCFTGNKSKKESIELFNNRQDEFYKFSVYFLLFLTLASFIVELWRLLL